MALLSDVHSNLHALEAVLEDVEAAAPDAVGFLGDAVGYNAHPDECVRLLIEHSDVAILGNHDRAVLQGGEEWFNPAARSGVRHSRDNLSKTSRTFLEEMVEQTGFLGAHLVHGSPRGPTTEYVFPEAPTELMQKIANHPALADASVLAMGHTHVPFKREVAGRLLTNVGSVGQPRDGDPRACWALVDPDGPEVEHRRVEYDIDGAAEAIREAGLPPQLAERLYDGR